MKLLEFDLNRDLLLSNRASLSDIFRLSLYENNETLFSMLDYEDDIPFLEPSLIGYFLSANDFSNKIPLEQILLGYIPIEERVGSVLVKSDIFGLVNLPNLGYLRLNPNQLFDITLGEIYQELVPDKFILNSSIRLNLHPTNHLAYADGIIFDEPVEETLHKNIDSLNTAITFFQENLVPLWTLVKDTTREFVVFSSPNHNSFAGINHQGTAYFNTGNKKQQSPVFFIEDISHQCGHVIFNILTLQTNDFLKVNKDCSLKNFSHMPNEMRDVYGAFHGLFTYTTIVYSLSKIIDLSHSYSNGFVIEAKARLGFFMSKFSIDLKVLNNSEIFTENGLYYHSMFDDSYQYVEKNYCTFYKSFNYLHQPYIFDFEIFKKENHIQ